MAAPPVVVEKFRVERGAGFTMSVVSLVDRRAAGNRIVRFVFQRHLEAVLYGRIEGSSGPIWKLMNQTGMSSTTLAVSKQSVAAGIITDSEYTAIMNEFRSSLPADMVDPSSLGRIRHCTILPIAAAATIVRNFGCSGAAIAWLRAFNQPVPQAWELREEQEANEAASEVDLLLNDQLDELGFEAEDMSFADELKQMAVFSTDGEDEERLKTYILSRVPADLKSELDAYILHRTATFAARRQGGAVQSISAEADRTALLRFFGYLDRLQRVPQGADLSISLLCRADLGDLAQGYAMWLQNTQQCKFSTIANYINGLVTVTTYAYTNFELENEVFNTDPNPLTQLINLRGQAEKASKTQQMYEKRVGGWLEWEDVQKARVAALNKLNDVTQTGTHAAKRSALRDAAALSLLSLIPPDRVGCIRKLRLGGTLKRKQGGGWMMDLSRQRDGHKTSRFYGPFAASLPDALTPILDKYANTLELEVGGDQAFLFHPPNGSSDRAMESSAWTGWVKRLFKRHHGEEIAPKTLRAVFITWLRDQTAAPEILKSAAHAMKHSEQRQGSTDYDQESDDRLVKAAYEFNLAYASGFATEAGGSSGEGSSSAAPLPPPPPPSEQHVQQPQQPQQQQHEQQHEQPVQQPHVDTQMLPPISIAQLTFMLEGVGFARSSADNNGDCFPLSAMAGFEITAAAARKPTPTTIAKVRQVREDAIDRLAGSAPVDFQLGVALEVGRPVAVIEKKGRTFLDPARIYGARNADGAPETVPTYRVMPIATLVDKLRNNPTAFSVVEYNGSNHFQPWILKPALRKAANAATATALAVRPVEVAPTAVSDEAQGAASLAGGAQEAVADEEEAVEDDDGEWIELDGAPFTAHLVKGGPRTTAPTRNYKVVIPFSDETPIYSGGKIKFPVVPGAPVDGIVLPMPLLPPVGAKELTFTLKLDRSGATADTVTINSVLYWKKVVAEAAEVEAGAVAGAEVEAEADQLALGDRFVVLDDPRMPFVVATVVEVGNSADDPRFDFSASGPRMLCGVRLVFYKSDAELQAAAPGLQRRTLDGISHFVGGCPDRRAARAANATPIPVSDPLVLGARFVVKDDPRNPFAIATVVAVNTDATLFMAGANGQKYHVRIAQFLTKEELLGAAPGLGERDLDDCHLVGVDMASRPPPRSSSRPRKRARLSHPSSQQEAISEQEVPLPTIVDDADHSDLTVGQSVIAYGRSPSGEWTKFNAVVKAFRERAPHVVVKYTSDLQGNAIRIGLPSPITAYLSRTDIEVMEG